MKKKEYWHKKLDSETIYSACKYFLEKSGIDEKDASTCFQIQIEDLTSDCKDSTEFFVKVNKAKQFTFMIKKDNYDFTVIKVSNLHTVIVNLPTESDIDNIIEIFDGIKLSKDGQGMKNLEQKLDKHMKRNTKIAIVGIIIAIISIISGLNIFF